MAYTSKLKSFVEGCTSHSNLKAKTYLSHTISNVCFYSFDVIRDQTFQNSALIPWPFYLVLSQTLEVFSAEKIKRGLKKLA